MKIGKPLNAAFGLLELLLSIGIIALLIALIYPGWIAVTESRKSARCINNLRNLGVALFSFTADHNGYYPSTLIIADKKWTNYWPDQLTPYLPNPGGKTTLNYPIKNAVFYCPAQTTHGTWGDYAANPAILRIPGGNGGTITAPLKVSQVTQPASRMLLSDGTNGRGAGSFYLDSNFVVDPRNTRTLTLTGTLYPPVHRKQFMNLLFADGHLETMHIEALIEQRKVLLGGIQDHP